LTRPALCAAKYAALANRVDAETASFSSTAFRASRRAARARSSTPTVLPTQRDKQNAARGAELSACGPGNPMQQHFRIRTQAMTAR
jgi:hypothetical protein